MDSFDDVFRACGGPASVARIIGVPTEHATIMRRRGSIPAAHWPKLIEGAPAEANITYEVLAQLAAKRRASTEPERARA